MIELLVNSRVVKRVREREQDEFLPQRHENLGHYGPVLTEGERGEARGPVGRSPRHRAPTKQPISDLASTRATMSRWRRHLGAVLFHATAGVFTIFMVTFGCYFAAQAVVLSVRGVEATAVVASTEVVQSARASTTWANVSWPTPNGTVTGSVMDRDYSSGQQVRVLYDPHAVDNVDNALPLGRRALFPLAALAMGLLCGGFWFRYRTWERR